MLGIGCSWIRDGGSKAGLRVRVQRVTAYRKPLGGGGGSRTPAAREAAHPSIHWRVLPGANCGIDPMAASLASAIPSLGKWEIRR